MKLFKDLKDYPEFNPFLNNLNSITAEYLTFIKKNVFITTHEKTIEWIKQQENDERHYAGGGNVKDWVVLPLYKDIVCYPNEFPITNNLIRRCKKINFAGFFCLKAMQSIPYHKHNTKTVILHVNLFPLSGGQAYTYLDESINGDPNTTDNYSTYYEKRFMGSSGDYVVFEPSLYHSAKNRSKTDRITFGVEIEI
jgi:hypothetical protein